MPRSIYFFIFILACGFENPANAFEQMGPPQKECSTVCHQAEHILQAKKNKYTQPECKTFKTNESRRQQEPFVEIHHSNHVQFAT
jgi:hypothetical protein